MELVFENLIGREVLAINRSLGDRTELIIPTGCVIGQEETGAQDSVLSGLGNTSSIAVSLETDKPVLGTGVSVAAVERVKTDALKESFGNRHNRI